MHNKYSKRERVWVCVYIVRDQFEKPIYPSLPPLIITRSRIWIKIFSSLETAVRVIYYY